MSVTLHRQDGWSEELGCWIVPDASVATEEVAVVLWLMTVALLLSIIIIEELMTHSKTAPRHIESNVAVLWISIQIIGQIENGERGKIIYWHASDRTIDRNTITFGQFHIAFGLRYCSLNATTCC